MEKHILNSAEEERDEAPSIGGRGNENKYHKYFSLVRGHVSIGNRAPN